MDPCKQPQEGSSRGFSLAIVLTQCEDSRYLNYYFWLKKNVFLSYSVKREIKNNVLPIGFLVHLATQPRGMDNIDPLS